MIKSPPLLNSLTYIGNINVDGLIKILNEKVYLWNENVYRQNNYFVHKNTESIILIWSSTKNNITINKHYYLFETVVKNIIKIIKNYFGWKKEILVTKVLFSKLKKNSVIYPHIDNDLLLKIPHRIHIPIVTNKRVETYITGNKYYLKKGNIYDFNNTRQHGIKNNSNYDRIHLIIDICEKKSLVYI